MFQTKEKIPTLFFPECPDEWQSFLNSCYYFGASLRYLSWDWATSACKYLHENSTLPSIHSAEEDQFLQANATSHPFWLGASREIRASHIDPSSWTWSDGTAMTFTAWASGQPNNYWSWMGERCLRSMETEGEKTWDDHICWDMSAKVAIVCKLQI